MESNDQKSWQTQFCRICGQRLLPGALFCPECGTKIVFMRPLETPCPESETQEGVCHNAIPEKVVQQPGIELISAEEQLPAKKGKRKLWKIIVPILSIAVLAILAILAIFIFLKGFVFSRDINRINGCPELYNVQFGMTPQEVSKQIRIDHEVQSFVESQTGYSERISMKHDETFKVYGYSVSQVLCFFSESQMDTVMFGFEKENATFEDIAALYTRIYGAPTKKNEAYITWSGKNMSIDVIYAETEYRNLSVVVCYDVLKKTQYGQLPFDGPLYDPCNFLQGDAFGRKPTYYTNGLKLDEEYIEEDYQVFKKYTLFPDYSYLGIESGMTAIAFDAGGPEEEINICSYLFVQEKSEAADNIKRIMSSWEQVLGTNKVFEYTSIKKGELGIEEISYTLFFSRMQEQIQGIYSVQWDTGDGTVMINLTMHPEKTYCEGAVAISN